MAVNPYLQKFNQELDKRFSKDSAAMTHGQWMCKNTTLNKKPFSFARYPFQEAIANDMSDNLDCMKPSQVGLALCLSTPVLTSLGWSTMGDLKVGDVIYNEQGQFTTVTYTSPIYLNRKCFDVEFDTGEVIRADANHRWYVEGDKAFNDKELWGKPGQPAKGYSRKGVVNTQMLAKNYHQKGRNLFAIPVAHALKGEDSNLLVEPYFLGFWLGDGHSYSSTVTVHDSDFGSFESKMTQLGYEISLSSRKGATACYKVSIPRNKDFCPRGHSKKAEGVEQGKTCALCLRQNKGLIEREESQAYDTLYGRLTTLKVIKNKHIPDVYLSSSVANRFALLQGLMDTGGSVTSRGRCSFYNTNPVLISQIEQLIHSLGFKCRTRWKSPSPPKFKNGQVINSIKPVAEVSFLAYSDTKIFNLDRKQNRLIDREKGRPLEALRRRIVRIKECPSVPVRCITVDSPSHLFLAGRGLIPTHNTEIQIRKVLSILARTENISVIYTMPNDKMFKRVSKGRIKPIIDTDRAFRNLHGNKNSMDLIQIGSSFLYVTGSTEGDATSINADMIFNDEVDLTDQSMLALFNSRLQGSDLRIKQRFSTPTYNGYGIHKGYSASDQHEFMIKCRACNTWQIPLFNKVFVPIPALHDKVKDWTDLEPKMLDSGDIDLNMLRICCEKCHRPLNMADYENRQWVARYPNRVHHRGYHVRPFSTHTLDPKYVMTQLFDYKRRSNMKGFFNTVLGETYSVGNNRLEAGQIEDVMVSASPIPLGDVPVFIGVDVGAVCHITIGAGNCENMTILSFETCMEDQLELRLAGLRKKFKTLGGGIDKYPYTPLSNAIRNQTGGLIMPVEYGQGREFAPILDEFKAQTGIRASRTVLLDTVAQGIRNGTWQLSGYGDEKETIITHLQDMVREEGTGEEEPRWVKLNGNDHYFHSLAFLVAAARNYEYQLGTGEFQHTDDDVVMTDLQDNGLSIFGASDLVGFGRPEGKTKIITRYT